MFKNLPFNAGAIGSIAGRRTKISYAIGHLSLCTASTEPMHSRTCRPHPETPVCYSEDPLVWQLRLNAAKHMNKQTYKYFKMYILYFI